MFVNGLGGLYTVYALPFLEAGIPTFVDKLFVISCGNCDPLLASAHASGAPLTSFSELRHALATASLEADLERIGSLTSAWLPNSMPWLPVHRLGF